MILTPNSLPAMQGVFTDFQQADLGTDGFDFMNLLLGLKQSQNPTENQTEQTLTSSESKDSKDNLLESLFPSVKSGEKFGLQSESKPETDEKTDAKAWSPMLPWMGSVPPTPVLATVKPDVKQAESVAQQAKANPIGFLEASQLQQKLTDLAKPAETNASTLVENLKQVLEKPMEAPSPSAAETQANAKALQAQSNSPSTDLKTLVAQMQQLFPEVKVDREEPKASEPESKTQGVASSKDLMRMLNVQVGAKSREADVAQEALDTDKSQKMQRFVQISDLNQAPKALQANGVGESMEGLKESSKDKTVKTGAEGTEASESLLQMARGTSMHAKELTGKPADAQAAVTVPQFMDRVQNMIQRGGGTMKVTLNPPELGEVEISVTTRGKKVEIAMKSENIQSKSILEGQVQELKNSIQSQDMVMTKFEVSVSKDFDSNFNQNQFTQMGFQDFKQNQNQNQTSKESNPFRPQVIRSMGSIASNWSPKSVSGGVDLRI